MTDAQLYIRRGKRESSCIIIQEGKNNKDDRRPVNLGKVNYTNQSLITVNETIEKQLYIGRGKRNIIATIYKETKLSDKIIQTQNKKKILEKQQRDEFETISKRV